LYTLITLSFCYFLVQPAGWELKKEWLPDGWLCLVCLSDSNIFPARLMPDQPSWLTFYIFWKVCGASDTQELPPNFIKLAKDAYTPDLMAASDCMLGNDNFKLFGIQGYLMIFFVLPVTYKKKILFQCRKNWIWHCEWGFGLQAAICICSKRLFQWRTIFAEYAWGWNILALTLC